MSHFLRRHPFAFVISAASLLILAAFVLESPPPPPPPVKTAPATTPPLLSTLAVVPDWSALEVYQNSITRAEFERLLTSVFTTGDAWQTCIAIDDTEARIETGAPGGGTFHLRFAKSDQETRAPRHWRAAAELPPAPAGRPLDGVRIAIDPGHIGGEWAKMEERWFLAGSGTPVREGNMTLLVAKLLKPRLESLGGIVSLVRNKTEPVTSVRPESLLSLAGKSASPDPSESPQKFAERLFYRTAEIRARADLVNRMLKPDLVLCLHFNAEPWGDPGHPILIDRSHLHLLVNGAYTNDEVLLADQRFALLQKLLQRTHREEVLIGSTVAATFAKASGLPPYTYPADSTSVRAIDGQPYLWARNLLANRLYDCPVIFMEPYVMNSAVDYARIQAGDYDGLREISGKVRPSIFREYADAVAEGLARYYSDHRAIR